jgi:hypothetical protein
MKVTIELIFKVDIKQSLFQAATDDMLNVAPPELDRLWATKDLTSTELLRPTYNIKFTMQE